MDGVDGVMIPTNSTSRKIWPYSNGTAARFFEAPKSFRGRKINFS